jgi:hypothetical protein
MNSHGFGNEYFAPSGACKTSHVPEKKGPRKVWEAWKAWKAWDAWDGFPRIGKLSLPLSIFLFRSLSLYICLLLLSSFLLILENESGGWA